MFKKGYKMTEEHKKRIGLANAISQKGRKFSKETKKKMSESGKGKHYYWLEKKMSPTHRKKMGESHKGSKSHLWRGGITPINRVIRSGIEYHLWREAVFARDNWICQKCEIRSGMGKVAYLHPHHILNFAQYPELRFAIDNGITLCEKCHRLFHKKFGKINNTKKQLEEFLIIIQ